uniref:Uncharacterized protein n=1 Tax=Anguilla anguilla TaxID=7936 RepID=A0A0E9S3Z4_ANGAN
MGHCSWDWTVRVRGGFGPKRRVRGKTQNSKR